MNVNEETIEKLLQRVGPRQAPSEAMAEEVKAQVKLAWQEAVAEHEAKKSTPTPMRWMAMAASLVVAVGVGFLVTQPGDEVSAGFASQVVNQVEYRAADGDWQPLPSNANLVAGTELHTLAGGYASVNLANGMTLRVDQNSYLTLGDDSQIGLDRGAVYAESEGGLDQFVTVTTPYGQARDIGTEFEVRVSKSDWRVQVREGLVAIEDDDLELTANAGERFVISQNQEVFQEQIGTADDSWVWTHQVASPFKLEGATLNEYLSWWSEETGRQVSFRDASDANAADAALLHGHLPNLSVDDSLQAVLASTRFQVVDSSVDQVILAR